NFRNFIFCRGHVQHGGTLLCPNSDVCRSWVHEVIGAHVYVCFRSLLDSLFCWIYLLHHVRDGTSLLLIAETITYTRKKSGAFRSFFNLRMMYMFCLTK